MKIQKRKVVGLLLTVLCITTACTPEPNYATYPTSSTQQAYIEKIPDQLFFIPHEARMPDFPDRYAKFLKDNPGLEVISTQPVLDESKNSVEAGTFIFTKKKEVSK